MYKSLENISKNKILILLLKAQPEEVREAFIKRSRKVRMCLIRSKWVWKTGNADYKDDFRVEF